MCSMLGCATHAMPCKAADTHSQPAASNNRSPAWPQGLFHEGQHEVCCVLQAVGLIGTTCYLSYLAGDEFKLSGIVSLFCCAVAMSHYGLHNISKHQRAASLSAFETLSSMAEGSVFVYVGLDSLDPQKWAVRPFLQPYLSPRAVILLA